MILEVILLKSFIWCYTKLYRQDMYNLFKIYTYEQAVVFLEFVVSVVVGLLAGNLCFMYE